MSKLEDGTKVVCNISKPFIVRTVNHPIDGEPHYEILACDHMNNLRLDGRVSGVCPKGCKE